MKTNNLDQLRSEKADAEHKRDQAQRQANRYANQIEYVQKRSRKERTHHLCIIGGAVEGVIDTEILLPNHAPREYADRQTLWNAVEFAERGKKAQLAYSFELALQTAFSVEENMALARQF